MDKGKRNWGLAMLAVGIVIGMVLIIVAAPLLAPAKAEKTLKERYLEAIDETMLRQGSYTYDKLNPVNDTNPSLIWNSTAADKGVLVLIFTRFNSSYPVNSNVTTWWGETWVTVVPDLKAFFEDNVASGTNKTLRTLQLLGLPWDSKNSYFVEAFVQPKDLFRPAGDNEIDDATAGMTLPSNASTAYVKWFNGNIVYSYYPKTFPWSRMGYTYDWGSDSHIGLSEYVLRQNSSIYIRSVSTVDAYLAA
ncbi:MAG: hypothetical protein A4E32_01711 [Methanomassiliicoccales archaeon PtaU1.Bin124]|nr:MAG: hypothetical protein A4E32_01711 [Methanomassiliicoccales archaeon PtaU1.Bin124]